MKLRDFILYFDIFPKDLKLQFENQDQHKSILGSIFGIMILITMIGFTYSFGKDVVQRKYPRVIRNQVEFKIAPVIEMTAQNIPFAFGLLDHMTYTPFKDEKALNFQIVLAHTQRVVNQRGEKLIQYDEQVFEPEQCEISKHFRNHAMDEVVKTIDFDSFYCLPYDKQLKFGGSWDLGETYILKIQLQKCDQTQRQCYDDEKINSSFKRGFVNFYFPHFNVDPTISNPLVRYSQGEWTSFSLKTPKTINLNFKKILMRIDNGALIDDIESQEEIGYSLLRQMSSDLDQNLLVDVLFFVDTTSQEITIRYLQIQEALANIGGFMKIIILIVGLIILRFQEIDLMNQVFQKILVWRERETHKKTPIDKSKNSDKIQEDTNQSINAYLMNTPARKQEEKNHKIDLKNAQFISNSFQSTQINLKDRDVKFLSFKDKLAYVFFCQKICQNHQFYEKSKEEISQVLNVDEIFKSLQDIQILKFLFLTEQQRFLLNFVKQPTITKLLNQEQINGGATIGIEKITSTDFQPNDEPIYKQINDSSHKMLLKQVLENDDFRYHQQTITKNLLLIMNDDIKNIIQQTQIEKLKTDLQFQINSLEIQEHQSYPQK